MKASRKNIGVRVVAALALASLLAMVAGADVIPIANLTERWNTDALWKLWADGPQRLFTGEAFGVKFAAKSDTAPSSPADFVASIVADVGGSNGRFVGNYRAAGIVALEFDIMADGVSRTVNVLLGAGDGPDGPRLWQYPVVLPEGESGWIHVKVPLQYSAGWEAFEGTEELFLADLEAVTYVGVAGFRNQGLLAEQKLLLDNFKVVGPWGGPFTDDGLPVYWLQEYGIGSGEGHAAEDPDGDGLNNYGEYLAGTDPNDAGSSFLVQIARNADGQNVLRWNHVLGRSFSILRTKDLTAGFDAAFTGITSAEPRNEFVLDEQDGGPYFYKVRIDQ